MVKLEPAFDSLYRLHYGKVFDAGDVARMASMLRCFVFGHQYGEWMVTQSLKPVNGFLAYYEGEPCMFRYCQRQNGCWGGEKVLLP